MIDTAAERPDGPNLTGTTQVEMLPTIGRRMLRVVRIEDVTPRYRRIVFTSDALGDFPFCAFAPSDHVKLFFPDPRTGTCTLPRVTDRGWELPESAGEPIFRDYTVRAYDPIARELAIDFVLHEHGIAGVWAGAARPGDELGQLGPRGTVRFPENLPRYIAAGDETALPAIARCVEEAPAGAHVTAVIEVASDAERQHIAAGPEVILDLRWVCRDTASIGPGHGSALETALRAVDIAPGEAIFVFAAGEAIMLKPIRRYLRRELGLAKEQVDVDGYWKRGTAGLDHHSPEAGGDDAE